MDLEAAADDRVLEKLEHIAIFGFDGHIPCGLKIHPDAQHLLFPLGNKVSVLNITTNKQDFLCGHTNTVSSIAISNSGSLIGSGQVNHMGFRAHVIIWNWEKREECNRHEIHKVRIESLCFTSNERYLISLGGRDDGTIVVWDIEKRSAICGAPATKEVTGHAITLKATHTHDTFFLSAGEQNLRLWYIDETSNKLQVLDANVGKLRRNYTSIKINEQDNIMYVGTMSGDIVKIQLNCSEDLSAAEWKRQPVLIGCFARHNPKKSYGKDCEKYMHGVRDLLILNNGKNLLIGAGDGTIELVEERNVRFKEYPSPTWPQFKALKRKKVNGCVSSLVQQCHSTTVLIGTEACEIYILNSQSFQIQLVITCNTSTVYDIAFPHNFSLVFATASYQSVRIWSTTRKQELLRIMVPNFSAAAIVFTYDGKSIVTAWNDGVIRAFTPLTGKLIYAIPNAHNKGCSALTISRCDRVLVSGGCEGQIRVWNIEPIRQTLIAVLKDHTAPIASLQFSCTDKEVVSASSDGTCIIWDISRLSRKQVIYANTQFTCARFFPTDVQILATGTDRKITYWEVLDGSLVRDIEGSTKGSINCISLNNTGEMFVSVGNDQVVKLWDYENGIPVCAGYGHAAAIVTCKYSPCGRFIVTGSADGAVIIWKVSQKYWPKQTPLAMKLSTLATNPKKTMAHEKKSEHIKELETSRTNKDVHISECPPIDLKNLSELPKKQISKNSGGKTTKTV